MGGQNDCSMQTSLPKPQLDSAAPEPEANRAGAPTGAVDGGDIEAPKVAPDVAGSAREAPEAAASPPRSRPRNVKIFIVRHGERIDETAAAVAWYEKAGDRWFDPPLTREGQRQADQAVRQLVEYLQLSRQQDELCPFDKVYCSPLIRTMMTAVEFGKVLDLPLQPVADLATCAAAFRKQRPAKPTLLPKHKLNNVCGGVEVFDFDTEYAVPTRNTFPDAIRKICRQAISDCVASGSTKTPSVLVVTHREGLRALSERTLTPFRRTKYCCIGVFDWRSASGRWNVDFCPEDFEAEQRRLRVERKAATFPAPSAADFHKIKKQLLRTHQEVKMATLNGVKQTELDMLREEEALLRRQIKRLRSSRGPELRPPVMVIDWNAEGEEPDLPPALQSTSNSTSSSAPLVSTP